MGNDMTVGGVMAGLTASAEMTVHRAADILTGILSTPAGYAELEAIVHSVGDPAVLDEAAIAAIKEAPSLAPLLNEIYGLPPSAMLRWIRVVYTALVVLIVTANDPVVRVGGLMAATAIKQALDDAIKKAEEQEKRDSGL